MCRAMGFRQLAKLISLKNSEAIEKSSELFNIILTSLCHEKDSFVYKSSIQCLTEIVLNASIKLNDTKRYYFVFQKKKFLFQFICNVDQNTTIKFSFISIC